MKLIKTPSDHPIVCPSCGNRMVGYQQHSPEGIPIAKPTPGEPVLCPVCVELLVFDEHLQLKQPLLKDMLLWSQATHQHIEQVMRWLRARRALKH